MSNKLTRRQKQPAEKEVSKFGRIVIDLWRQRKNNNMLMEKKKKSLPICLCMSIH